MLRVLLIKAAPRPEKDFVGWAHAYETWEMVMKLGHLRLYEASRVKKFFAINISSLPSFKRGSCERSSALMARQTPLLGRAERSTPKARRVAPKARGVDGESARRATMVSGHYACKRKCVFFDSPFSPLTFR